MASLELRNINVFYGQLRALWNVSMEIESGTFVSLIGSNGAGKSTVLKSIIGLAQPRSGEIILDGAQIEKLTSDKLVEAGLAYVPEGRRLFPDFTVLENLEMGSYPKHARNAKEASLSAVYEIFPLLRERSKQKAGTLSGGEAQMVAIARAMMSKPKILMLDEPSAGLAPVIVSKIFEAISKIQELLGTTILVVEQDVVRALSISSRAHILESGRITKSGTGKELLNDEYVRKAYLGLYAD